MLLGITTVSWNTQVMSIRITNRSDDIAYWSAAARGLCWAADNGNHVANNRYDMTNRSTVSSAAQLMRSKGWRTGRLNFDDQPWWRLW